MQPVHAYSRAAHACCSMTWLVVQPHSHIYSALLTADARGAEVMASTGNGGENIVLSNTNKRAETEMVLAVSVGKLLERTVGLRCISPFA